MNPLFNSLFGGQQAAPTGQAGSASGPDISALMGQLQANPAEMLGKAGYQVPAEMMGNPQSMVMHLIQSGQVSGPMMQRIQPMMKMLGMR